MWSRRCTGPTVVCGPARTAALGAVDGHRSGRGVLGGCALQAHTAQPPEMAALTKPRQQSGTESCAVDGNVPGEA